MFQSEISASFQLNKSGQTTIIPKPELRAFWVGSLTKPPFGVTSAEVAIICPEKLLIERGANDKKSFNNM